LLACLLALAGCAGQQTTAAAGSELVDLLDYRERLLAMAPAAQQEAYQAAAREVERQPDAAARLRLALALSLPRAPWRDDRRLLALLGEIESATAPAQARRALARLISGLVQEQQRLLGEEKQRLAAEQHKAVRDEHQRMLVERQRLLREEQRRTEELQAKLDALLKIDRQLRQKSRPR
jgi:hypothetical protein